MYKRKCLSRNVAKNTEGTGYLSKLYHVEGVVHAPADVEVRVKPAGGDIAPVTYTHLRAHETTEHSVCRLLLEKKNLYKSPIPLNRTTYHMPSSY